MRRGRTTLALVGSIIALFTAAMSVAGIGHQIGWLSFTDERLILNPWELTPCSHPRERAPSAWAEHWRAVPLDGAPAPTSRRHVALPRHPDDPRLSRSGATLCGTGGVHGERLADAELDELLHSCPPSDPPAP